MLGANKGKISKCVFTTKNFAEQTITDLKKGNYESAAKNANQVFEGLKTLEKLDNQVKKIIDELEYLE